MALSDFVPASLRAKPIGGHAEDPHAPRVSGVADEAIVPVPEHFAGHNIPYRGTEQHGVTPGPAYSDHRDEIRKSVDVHVSPADHPPAPILVKVVRENGEEERDWRVISAVATAVPSMVVNRMHTRTLARVLNNGTVTINVGRAPTMNVNNSFPIAAGQYIEMKHTEDVWVTSADGSSQDVRVYVEFRRDAK